MLNIGTADETCQQSEKQCSFRHIMKSSTSMCENSGTQFFRTITGIQSGPDILMNQVPYNLFNSGDETGHSVLSLLESQWKLRQQHD